MDAELTVPNNFASQPIYIDRPLFSHILIFHSSTSATSPTFLVAFRAPLWALKEHTQKSALQITAEAIQTKRLNKNQGSAISPHLTGVYRMSAFAYSIIFAVLTPKLFILRLNNLCQCWLKATITWTIVPNSRETENIKQFGLSTSYCNDRQTVAHELQY